MNIPPDSIIHLSHYLKDTKDVENYYSTWSKSYDSDVKSCKYVGPKSIINVLIELFNINNTKIIDIGCGTGLIADILDKNKFNIQVDGMDLSQEMLNIASEKKYYTNLYQKNVYLIDENVEQKYDYAISVGMFTHSHVKPNAIENILHLLKNHGSFIFTVRNSFRKKENFDEYINNLLKNKKIVNFITIENVEYIQDEDCCIYVIYN